ncbi:aldo/keto reductase [Gammaproteobacteria bacterium]|nr:aldo/keto reductase [Gammaproteobacteria bacterium]
MNISLKNKKKLILGTAQFKKNYGKSQFNNLHSKEIKEILEFAYQNQIIELDTAPDYGDSEIQIGQAQTKHLITSKIPSHKDLSISFADWIEASIHKTLLNTKRKSIETILFHNPHEFIANYSHEVNEKISSIKEMGLIKNAGISVYETREVDQILEIFKPDILQFPLNPFDQRFLENNKLKDIRSLGIETIARSIFLQGVLVSENLKDKEYFQRWDQDFSQWRDYCKSKNLKPYEACISFILGIDSLDGYTLGVGSLKELQEIASAIKMLDISSNLFVNKNFQNQDIDLIDPRRWP